MNICIKCKALLKIAQISRESASGLVSGQLVGIDINGSLEVTDVFSLPQSIADEAEQEEYQLELIKSLRDVNVDHNVIGWFQTCSLESFVSPAFIEAQLGYQKTVPNSVFIAYDHFLSCQGAPVLKAYRLSPEYVSGESIKSRNMVSDFSKVLLEVPIKVSVSMSERLFLLDCSQRCQLINTLSDQVCDTQDLLLCEAAHSAIKAFDDYLSETSRLQYHLRNLSKQHGHYRNVSLLSCC